MPFEEVFPLSLTTTAMLTRKSGRKKSGSSSIPALTHSQYSASAQACRNAIRGEAGYLTNNGAMFMLRDHVRFLPTGAQDKVSDVHEVHKKRYPTSMRLVICSEYWTTPWKMVLWWKYHQKSSVACWRSQKSVHLVLILVTASQEYPMCKQYY